MTFASLAPLYPELILAIGAMAILMYGVFRPETDAEGEIAGWLAIAVIVAAAAVIATQPAGAVTVFERAFISDAFTRFMKMLVLVGAGIALVLSFDEMRERKVMRFEYPVLLLLSTVGMMMMVSANDLISLYIGLELQSLALYVLAAYRRDDVRSSEAGLKYFVLGALSSGMLLYGASLIYGFTGSTSFDVIATVATSKDASQNVGLIIGLVFLMVGVAFKISAVPFHMWTPDVYEGSPTPVTALFASAPKIAAMALMMRVVLGAFPGMMAQWQQIIVALSIGSMVFGAFAAIGQTNIKRLMAYSSIANIGFALVGLAAGTAEGVQGVLFYLAIYVAMTLGVFACILSMRRASGPVEEINELAGLSTRQPGVALVLALLMFSLVGIPPLGGFFAKYFVFAPVMKAGGGLIYLAVIGMIASVIGAYYYLRIIKIMYFDAAAADFEPVHMKAGAVMALAAAFVVLAFLPLPYMPGGAILDAAAGAAKSFRY